MEISVKELRKKLGFTQQKMAEELGVTLQTIQNWESGRKIPDSKKKLLLLYNNSNSGVIVNRSNNNNIDNRKYYSDSPDVLRKEIDLLDERIKEKDAQIKEKDAQIKEKDAQIKTLLDILNNYSVNCNKK